MRYNVYLDSTQSMGTSPSQCKFELYQQIVGAYRLKVKSFTFGNNLHNMNSTNNTLIFEDTSLTVPANFYTFGQLITCINNALMADLLFTANLTTEPNAVVLNADGISATWTIGSNVLLSTSKLYDTFVLNEYLNYTGNFQSSIFLSQPMCIALFCSNLQGTRFVTVDNVDQKGYFYVAPIQSGFGEMEPPAYDVDWTTQFSNNNISQLNIEIYDPSNNFLLTEIAHWALILEIET